MNGYKNRGIYTQSKYTQDYSAIKRNAFVSVLMRWMNLEPIIQKEVRSEKQMLYINAYIWNLLMNLFAGQQWRCRHREQLVDTSGGGR